MRENIGIVVIASNGYFPLGIRFIKRFFNYYRGERVVKFLFFSDRSPYDCIPDDMEQYVKHIPVEHNTWVDGTNSKFTSILSIDKIPGWRYLDYIYYFDADTNIHEEFTEDWFIGDLVGGEHFLNREYIKQGKFPFERNPESACYIPENTTGFNFYYYGAFFGGIKKLMLKFCETLLKRQKQDQLVSIEPIQNDESYINHYFHYNPPKIVFTENFKFQVSCKAGLEKHTDPNKGWMRDPTLKFNDIICALQKNKNNNININNGEVVTIGTKTENIKTKQKINSIDSVFVLAMTGAGNEGRAHACLRNWLKYFNNYLFTTDTYLDPDIKHVVATSISKSWHACPEKIFNGLKEIVEKNSACNWVLITDDDTFINPINFSAFINTLDYKERKVYGRDMTGSWSWKNEPISYTSGHAHLLPMHVVIEALNYIKEKNWMPWLTSLSVFPPTLHGDTDSPEDRYPIQAQADIKLGWVLSQMGIQQISIPELFREEPPSHYKTNAKDILNRISYHRIFPDQQDIFQNIIETGISKIA